jgi:hypothetical protein
LVTKKGNYLGSSDSGLTSSQRATAYLATTAATRGVAVGVVSETRRLTIRTAIIAKLPHAKHSEIFARAIRQIFKCLWVTVSCEFAAEEPIPKPRENPSGEDLRPLAAVSVNASNVTP